MKYKRPIIAMVMAVCMCTIPALSAFAATGKEVAEKLLACEDKYDLTGIINDAGDVTEFPEVWDLREKGVVTPVKFQNPWGTCWGFAACAAAETSILSEMGKTYNETGLDLSEHQLAYFARTPLKDGSSQDGEGSYMLDETEPVYNSGGWMYTATSVFSSGIGVVSEGLVPYRGKKGVIYSQFGLLVSYSADDDWTVDEDYRFLQQYELEESNILPEPAMKKYNELKTEYEYLGYNELGTNAIKNELMQGRAVSIGFCADQSQPGQSGDKTKYISDKWCHYTYDNGVVNHAVTIVGWDDTIKAADFKEGFRPEGDGAWIVKNSWGAQTSAFPNTFYWGMENEKGEHTGYFYLSYYDHSISSPESFDFDVKESNEAYIIDQYDYMPSDGMPNDVLSENEIRTANIFEAEYDELVRAISVETAHQYEDVHCEIYLLGDGFADPTDGEKVAEFDEHYVYAGYHRINLAEQIEVLKGKKYSVVVTHTVDTGDAFGKLYSISVDEARNKEGLIDYNSRVEKDLQEKAYSVAVVNPGESFVYIGENSGNNGSASAGTWTDWREVVDALHEDEVKKLHEFDNFPIKSYASFKDPAVAAEIAGEGIGCCYPEPEHSTEWYQNQAYEQLMWMILGGIAAAFVLLIVALIVIRNIVRKNRWKRRLVKVMFVGDGNLCQLPELVKELALSKRKNADLSIVFSDDEAALNQQIGEYDYVVTGADIAADADLQESAKAVWGKIEDETYGKAAWKKYKKEKRRYTYVERLVRRQR